MPISAQDNERKEVEMQYANAENRQNGGFTFLSPPESLITKLNLLGDAQRTGNVQKAQIIEREIKQMAKLGLYEGYPDDDLRPAVCSVFAVERANKGANTHTFHVCFFKLSDLDPDKVYHMDLIDFLSPVWRTTNALGRVHHGPKFWQ